MMDNCSSRILRALKIQCLLFGFFLFWYVLFVCRFMVFEVHNSMKMNFCVGFSDGTGLLLQWGWFLNEECGSRWGVWMEARES